jgi:deferrochelatase/peroxidase EfeB
LKSVLEVVIGVSIPKAIQIGILDPSQKNSDLKPYIGKKGRFPVTEGDYFLFAKSERMDLLFLLIQKILAKIRNYVNIVQEIYGFSYLAGNY